MRSRKASATVPCLCLLQYVRTKLHATSPGSSFRSNISRKISRAASHWPARTRAFIAVLKLEPHTVTPTAGAREKRLKKKKKKRGNLRSQKERLFLFGASNTKIKNSAGGGARSPKRNRGAIDDKSVSSLQRCAALFYFCVCVTSTLNVAVTPDEKTVLWHQRKKQTNKNPHPPRNVPAAHLLSLFPDCAPHDTAGEHL